MSQGSKSIQYRTIQAASGQRPSGVVVTALWAWIVSNISAPVAFDVGIKTGLVAVFVLFGLSFVASAILAFRGSKTTVDPTKTDSSTSLVTNGIYRWTRNSMYVGLGLFLIAWDLLTERTIHCTGYRFCPLHESVSNRAGGKSACTNVRKRVCWLQERCSSVALMCRWRMTI